MSVHLSFVIIIKYRFDLCPHLRVNYSFWNFHTLVDLLAGV